MSDKQLIALVVVIVVAVLGFVGFSLRSETATTTDTSPEMPPPASEVAKVSAQSTTPLPPASVETPVDRESQRSRSQEPKGQPFEFKVLSEKTVTSLWGKAVLVEVQVRDDVARAVTKADLESLVPHFVGKYNGGIFDVYFETETPLIQPWASISHHPHSTLSDKLTCQIHGYAFEFGPWYFPDRIDPNTKWHELVWLTLPMGLVA